ncbi:MAG TPA: glycosyltransferase family 39 protein, partial [Acidimicrobiales bacterium]|nr:glycosyltransferase family 39 protein [Acidimicrobiales bacterium]
MTSQHQTLTDAPRTHRRAVAFWERSPTLWRWVLCLMAMLLTVDLRLMGLGHAYDVFGDEIYYVDLGRSLWGGHYPPQFQHQGPFLLHPPLFFGFEAAWRDLFGPQASYFHLLYLDRDLNVVFAAISAGALFFIGERLGGRLAGAAAALLFAFSPYILRLNGRVLLETSALAFVLVGYAILFHALGERGRRARWWGIGAGIVMGLGVVCTDMAGLVTVVPLAVLLGLGWRCDRRTVALAVVGAIVPYVAYLVTLGASGTLGAFIHQETFGLRRLLGLVQVTGFNQAGAPSLVGKLLAQIAHFITTYLVCGLGVASAVYCLFSRRRELRVLGLFVASAILTLGYAVFFGTVEEQFLYFLSGPSILGVVVTGAALARGEGRLGARVLARFPRPRALGAGLLVVLLAAVAYDGSIWYATRTTPDNGLQREVAWFHRNVPHPGVIGTDSGVNKFLLTRSGE